MLRMSNAKNRGNGGGVGGMRGDGVRQATDADAM